MAREHAELMQLETEDIENLDAENHTTNKLKIGLNKRWAVVVGVFAVVAVAGILSTVRPRGRVDPTADMHASIDLVRNASIGIVNRNDTSWTSITCPVLGALFRFGDLLPDNNGTITKTQTRDAMLRVGISESIADATSNGNFDHLPEPKEINIFKMNLKMADMPLAHEKSLEHDKSTGVRDRIVPNRQIFEAVEQFADTDGIPDSWSAADVQAVLDHFEDHPNDIGSGAGSLDSIMVMFNEFKDEDGTLSVAEWKNLFLNSVYPKEFRQRRLSAIEAWDATVAAE